MQLPSIDALQGFVAAAQTLNFRRAARLVALTPAALGHRIPLHREELVFVAAPALLRRQPLRQRAQAAGHTLFDTAPDLPLFRYWREAPGGGELSFARVLRVGSLAAIHRLVLEGRGVAV